MTKQRAARIKKLLKKATEMLNEKINSIPQKEKIRIICMNVKLGKYECVIYYDLKKDVFTQITVIEEIIELCKTEPISSKELMTP